MIVLAIALCGALVFLLPRTAQEQPVAPQYDGPTNFDDLREGSKQLRARLDALQRAVSAACTQ